MKFIVKSNLTKEISILVPLEIEDTVEKAKTLIAHRLCILGPTLPDPFQECTIANLYVLMKEEKVLLFSFDKLSDVVNEGDVIFADAVLKPENDNSQNKSLTETVLNPPAATFNMGSSGPNTKSKKHSKFLRSPSSDSNTSIKSPPVTPSINLTIPIPFGSNLEPSLNSEVDQNPSSTINKIQFSSNELTPMEIDDDDNNKEDILNLNIDTLYTRNIHIQISKESKLKDLKYEIAKKLQITNYLPDEETETSSTTTNENQFEIKLLLKDNENTQNIKINLNQTILELKQTIIKQINSDMDQRDIDDDDDEDLEVNIDDIHYIILDGKIFRDNDKINEIYEIQQKQIQSNVNVSPLLVYGQHFMNFISLLNWEINVFGIQEELKIKFLLFNNRLEIPNWKIPGQSNIKILDIKKLIISHFELGQQNETSLLQNIEIQFKDKILRNEESLSQLNILSNCTINVSVPEFEQSQLTDRVFVGVSSIEPLSFWKINCCRTETVRVLQHRIQLVSGIAVGHQKLKFKSDVLDPSRTILSYGLGSVDSETLLSVQLVNINSEHSDLPRINHRPVSAEITSPLTKRLYKEFSALEALPISGWKINVNVDDITTWYAVLTGSFLNASAYHAGFWAVRIVFPANYPSVPPLIRFLTPIFHCNINKSGDVCLDILQDNWSPMENISNVLSALTDIINSPNFSETVDRSTTTNLSEYFLKAEQHTALNAEKNIDDIAKKFPQIIPTSKSLSSVKMSENQFSRTVIQLSLAKSIIHSNSETDNTSLKEFGFSNNMTIYATYYKSDKKKEDTVPSSIQANLDRFRDNIYWRSILKSQNEYVTLSDRGVSSYLSTLLCFVDHVKEQDKNVSITKKLLSFFRQISQFPPAVLVLYTLISGSSITNGEQVILSQTFFFLMRQLYPLEISDAQVSEQSRIFFTYLLTEPILLNELQSDEKIISLDESIELFGTIDLTCSLTNKRLIHPVFVKKSVVDKLIAARRNGVENTVDSIIDDDDDSEFVLCSASSVSALKHRFPFASDAAQLLQFNPSRSEVIVWKGVLTNQSSFSLSSIARSWKSLCSRKSPSDCLSIFSPLALKNNRAPKLTLDSNGNVAVYTSRGKSQDANLNLFSPLEGEISADAQQLAQQIEKLKLSNSLSDSVNLRKPEEAIFVCLDVSGSMGEDCHFPDDENNDDEGHLSDDENWEWEGDDEDNEKDSSKKSTLAEDDNIEQIEARIRREKEEFDRAIEVLKSDQNFSIMQQLSKRYSVELVLRELCRLEDFEYPRSCKLFQLISKHYVRFAEVLMEVDADDGQDETAQTISDNPDVVIPKDFVCPISMQLYQDPVIASDGFTYERATITTWIEKGHGTSPMTGALMSSNELIPNNNMRSQVSNWISKLQTLNMVEIISSETNPSETETEKSDEIVIKLKFSNSSNLYFYNSNVSTEPTKVYSLKVSKTSTIKDIKRACIKISEGKFYPQEIIYKGTKRANNLTVEYLKVQSGEMLMALPHPTGNNVTVVIDSGWRGKSHFICSSKDTGKSLLWRIWRDFDRQPSTFSLWVGLVDTGDGIRRGHMLRATSTVGQFLKGASSLELTICRANDKQKYQNKKLCRLDAVKQLFHAFVERTEAYDLPHHIGLVLFGSEATCVCELTPYFEEFKNKVDEADWDGDTCMYDALSIACTKLENFALKYPDCKKRILCLSDGEDSKSTIQAHLVARTLQENLVVCDSIVIGESNQDSVLKALSFISNGYSFFPRTLKEALHLNELETLLSLSNRGPRERYDQKVITSASQFTKICRNLGYFDEPEDAIRAPEPMLQKPVTSLDKILNNIEAETSSKDEKTEVTKPIFGPLSFLTAEEIIDKRMLTIPSSSEVGEGISTPVVSMNSRDRQSTRRILTEMRKLMLHPHPSIDIYPCGEDIGFWKVILQAPDSTPYAQGCYLLFVKFPNDFPSSPPEIRFVTPIHHCNINSHGKICHSILDRNWMTETSMSTVFDCIFGLLLSPDRSDPLDSHNALAYYDDSGGYEASVMEHTLKYASKSRADWTHEMSAYNLSTFELLIKVNQHFVSAEQLLKNLDVIEFEKLSRKLNDEEEQNRNNLIEQLLLETKEAGIYHCVANEKLKAEGKMNDLLTRIAEINSQISFFYAYGLFYTGDYELSSKDCEQALFSRKSLPQSIVDAKLLYLRAELGLKHLKKYKKAKSDAKEALKILKNFDTSEGNVLQMKLMALLPKLDAKIKEAKKMEEDAYLRLFG